MWCPFTKAYSSESFGAVLLFAAMAPMRPGEKDYEDKPEDLRLEIWFLRLFIVDLAFHIATENLQDRDRAHKIQRAKQAFESKLRIWIMSAPGGRETLNIVAERKAEYRIAYDIAAERDRFLAISGKFADFTGQSDNQGIFPVLQATFDNVTPFFETISETIRDTQLK
jgi:hypothetical protein